MASRWKIHVAVLALMALAYLLWVGSNRSDWSCPDNTPCLKGLGFLGAWFIAFWGAVYAAVSTIVVWRLARSPLAVAALHIVCFGALTYVEVEDRARRRAEEERYDAERRAEEEGRRTEEKRETAERRAEEEERRVEEERRARADRHAQEEAVRIRRCLVLQDLQVSPGAPLRGRATLTAKGCPELVIGDIDLQGYGPDRARSLSLTPQKERSVAADGTIVLELVEERPIKGAPSVDGWAWRAEITVKEPVHVFTVHSSADAPAPYRHRGDHTIVRVRSTPTP